MTAASAHAGRAARDGARLLAVSDLHVGFPENRAIAERLQPVTDADWLIVAGDVGEQAEDIESVLTTLSQRFAKVIWVPGNRELWTHGRDPLRLRGEERYLHLVAACRRLGVVTPEDPYPAWPGEDGPVIVVPLFVLYDYSFRPEGAATTAEGLERANAAGVVSNDERLLHPDPYPSREAWCADRLARTKRRAGRAASRGADRADQSLSAGAGADRGDAVPGVCPVVRNRADGRLASALRSRRGCLRAPAHTQNHVARRHPARGGIARLSARVEAAQSRTHHPAPDPADRGAGRERRRTSQRRIWGALAAASRDLDLQPVAEPGLERCAHLAGRQVAEVGRTCRTPGVRGLRRWLSSLTCRGRVSTILSTTANGIAARSARSVRR